MSNRPELVLGYLGWSGFRIVFPDGTELYIDPPKGTALPLDHETNILITHGHPEHIAGTVEHLCNPGRNARVLVAASAAVCRYFSKRSTQNADHFQPCKPQQHINISGLDIDIFKWRHMPLLPPGFKPVLNHIKCLISHPDLALSIIAAGLRGPLPFPMLGFRIMPLEGPRVLVYGEGLHRLTDRTDTRRIGIDLPAEILLVAVEPEDINVLPDLVNTTGITTIGLYEAHRGWREAFDMPCADLEALASVLETPDKHILVFRSGSTLPIAG